jgi:hypothetical protein
MKNLLEQLKVASNEIDLVKRAFNDIEGELDKFDAKEYQEYIWKAEDALFEFINEIEGNI